MNRFEKTHRLAMPFCIGVSLLVVQSSAYSWQKVNPNEANQLSMSGTQDEAYIQCNVTLEATFCSKAGDEGVSWKLVEEEEFTKIHEVLTVAENKNNDLVFAASNDADKPLHDCVSCHEENSVLSADHPPTTSMSMSDCLNCHVPHEALSLAGKLSLSHTHILGGIGCASCHGDIDPPEDPGTALCLSCHGPLESLAATTSDVEPTNPHSSPHGPPFAECSLCHLQHEPAENFCASCHDFEFNLP